MPNIPEFAEASSQPPSRRFNTGKGILAFSRKEPLAPANGRRWSARGFFKEKAFLAIHPRSCERSILAFSRKPFHGLHVKYDELVKSRSPYSVHASTGSARTEYQGVTPFTLSADPLGPTSKGELDFYECIKYIEKLIYFDRVGL